MEATIHEVLHKISHLLPTQGPIDVFIHHNTLHAFEHLPFETAVREAGKVFGAQAFLTERRYLEEYASGRITDNDLLTTIQKEVGNSEAVWGLSVSSVMRLFFTLAPAVESFQQVKWLLRESPQLTREPKVAVAALRAWVAAHRGRAENLYALNYQAAQGLSELIEQLPEDDSIAESERFVLWAAVLMAVSDNWQDRSAESGVTDQMAVDEEMINPLLIRFAEEYLDLGFSSQLLPGRETGMLNTFLNLVERAHHALPKWLEPLSFELKFYQDQTDAHQLLESLLNDFRVPEAERYEFLLREALSLRGWTGYISLAEHQPQVLHHQEHEIKPRLVDYLNVRLILKKYASRSSEYRSREAARNEAAPELHELDLLYCFAYHILHLVSALGKAQEFLLQPEAAAKLINLAREFPESRRRKLWHRAYEEHFYSRSLDALAHHHRIKAPMPIAQFVFCIDDREESIRRHLEAQNNCYQTYGTAGFFGVDANYTEMSGNTSPRCPVIVTPTHAVREVPKAGVEAQLSWYQRKQQAWFRMSGYINRGSGSYLHSAILSLAGCLSFIPMVFGVIAPRGMHLLGKLFGAEGTIPADLAELQLDGEALGELELPGYTLEEMSDRVAAVLKGIGAVENFAEIFILIGHGSSSRNNPLRSAYECGACGGRPGRMNPRAFSMMANQASVRQLVRTKHGVDIPDQTHFIGGFHNTCSDQIEFFDLDKCPVGLSDLMAQIKTDIKISCKLNALERCRRFVQAQVKNADQAQHEALARSLMLSEARPEYNHATNALCIIGPRELTSGLFLDRRAFLFSYNAAIDSTNNILLGIMRAVVPVCGGINLEYLFSTMDNEVYGAGTKLPHNIVSLVGLMNGTSSDLRTGLPLQMIEIHEPVRLLVVVATSKDRLEAVIKTDAAIAKAFDGEWIKLVAWDASANTFDWRRPGGVYESFKPSSEELPQINKYSEWFSGKSNHLEFAEISA